MRMNETREEEKYHFTRTVTASTTQPRANVNVLFFSLIFYSCVCVPISRMLTVYGLCLRNVNYRKMCAVLPGNIA